MPLQKCHQGLCRACSLCKAANAKTTHPVMIKGKNEKAYQLLKSFKRDVVDTKSICMPCAKQISRNVGKHNFTPRWLLKPNKPPDKY